MGLTEQPFDISSCFVQDMFKVLASGKEMELRHLNRVLAIIFNRRQVFCFVFVFLTRGLVWYPFSLIRWCLLQDAKV